MTTLARRLRAERKQSQRRRVIKKVALAVIIISIALSGFLGLIFSKRFQVSTFEVSGSKRVSEEDIRTYVDEWLSQKRFLFFSERLYWFLDSDALVRGMQESFPQLRAVRAQKNFPNRLSIAVEEYEGWGVLCHKEPEECFWIDHGGVAFDPAPGFTGVIVPKVRDERERDVKLGERQLSDALMRLITYFNDRAVSDADLQSIEFVIAARDETIRIKTRAGWEILLLENTDPERAYKNLRIAIDADIKEKIANLAYIDLRFGNKIFYKFR